MFNRKFMEELFKPQELYSKKALRTVYDRLAHASIMRLNQASMDKVSRQPLNQLSSAAPLLPVVGGPRRDQTGIQMSWCLGRSKYA